MTKRQKITLYKTGLKLSDFAIIQATDQAILLMKERGRIDKKIHQTLVRA
jgi:hypothetical protein